MMLAIASTSVLAHSRGRVTLGLHFGFPVYYPAPYWYYPPPVYYYPVPVSPPVYVERDPAPQVQEQWWYYCEPSRGYYPYVKECPSGWQRVPPAPAPAK